jgi:Flp pilus assembly protein TadG
VEFAILLPLLLLIVLGTIDLGMGFKTYIALTNADREGARWITIHPSDEAGARARVAEEAVRVGLTNGVLDQNWYGVSFSPPEGNKYKAGDKVTVTVEYEYKLLFGAITGLPAIHFAANSTMVVLYDE